MSLGHLLNKVSISKVLLVLALGEEGVEGVICVVCLNKWFMVFLILLPVEIGITLSTEF
jgi:hypothetical protein